MIRFLRKIFIIGSPTVAIVSLPYEKGYNCKCAIAGFDAQEVLQAAHIDSYKGEQTNNFNNGLLLRCDIHTLFDLYRITIHPESYQVIISQKLHQTSYQALHNRKVNLPSQGTISKDALQKHYTEFLKREQKMNENP